MTDFDPIDPPAPRPRAHPRCPICRAPTETKYRPFCSRRCSDVDLARWLGGAYAIAGDIEGDEDGDEAAAATGASRDFPEADRGEPDA